MGRQKPGHHGQQDHLRRRPRGVDPQGADRLPAVVVEIVQCIVDVAEGGSEPGTQALAGLGQGDTPRRSIEKTDIETTFQRTYRVTERGRCMSQFVCRAPKALVAGNRQERPQIVIANGAH
jgi:hypothetical protein